MTDKRIIPSLAAAFFVTSGAIAVAAPAAMSAPNPDHWRSQGMRATEALNLLEAKGDGQFTSFTRSGADFTAEVTKHGKQMQVMINPDTKQIMPTGTMS